MKSSLAYQRQGIPRLMSASLCSLIFLITSLSCSVSTLETGKYGAPSLKGTWKITLDDREKNSDPDTDTGSWDSITLPGSLSDYSLKKTGKTEGIAWIRRAFTADANDGRSGTGLILGKLADADMTYVNGILIGTTGRFPPSELSFWNQNRFYFIPASVIRREGGNIIAVRVNYTVHGEIRGPFLLPDSAAWNSIKTRNLLCLFANYAVIAAGAAIGLIFLLIYLRRPEWKESLYFLLKLFTGLFIIYESCGLWWPYFLTTAGRTRLFFVMWSALAVVDIAFLHRMYGLSRIRIEMAGWSVFLANLILLLFAYDPAHHRLFGLAVLALLIPLGLYTIYLNIEQMSKRHLYAKYLLIQGIILPASAAHDLISYLPQFGGPSIQLWSYGFGEPLFGYTGALMFIGVSVILVHRFMSAVETVEDLNVNLEKKVGERTSELEKSLNDLSTLINNTYIDQRIKSPGKFKHSITPGTEEKIKRAILYINENYTADISRENLAASLDINPDHLGKVFRIYTGKKITDYINELRIKKAIILIEETDETLLHIALSVGFESVRTFNRAFYKFIKIKPSEYRRTAAHRTDPV